MELADPTIIAAVDREELARRAELLQTVSVGRWWALAGPVLAAAAVLVALIGASMWKVAGGDLAGQDLLPAFCTGDPAPLSSLQLATCERGRQFESVGLSTTFTSAAIAFGLLGAAVTAGASVLKTRADASRLAGSVDYTWLRRQGWSVRWATRPFLQLVAETERATPEPSQLHLAPSDARAGNDDGAARADDEYVRDDAPRAGPVRYPESS